MFAVIAALLGLAGVDRAGDPGLADQGPGSDLVRVAGRGGRRRGYHGPHASTDAAGRHRTSELPEGEPVGAVLPPEAIAARVDGELRDLSFVPTADATVEPVDPASTTTGSTCCGTPPRT